MNNAYIMGYADRGPIYDYSWITTTKEFTKIYGEPQTEAEKYLFIAVQSVLQNGGTPIVARMPYDNKQCKAYKAMKIKWADIDETNGRLDDPVIPLSTIQAKVNRAKDLSAIFTTDSVTVNGDSVSKDFIRNLRVTDLLKQLNPYQTGSAETNGKIYSDFIYGFKLNGVYPSALNVNQNAIVNAVESAYGDMTETEINVYKYDDGLDNVKYESVNPDWLTANKFFNSTISSYPFYDKYVRIEGSPDSVELTKDVYFFNIFCTEDSTWSKTETDTVGETDYKVTEFYVNANEIPPYMTAALSSILSSKGIDPSLIVVDEVSNTASLSGIAYEMNRGVIENDLSAYIVDGPVKGYYCPDLSGKLVVEPSYIVNGKVVPIYKADDKEYLFALPQVSGFVTGDGSISRDLDIAAFSGAFSNADYKMDNSKVHGYANAGDGTKFYDSTYARLLPLYSNTVNGKVVINGAPAAMNEANLNAAQSILIGFVNIDTETPAITGKVRINDVKDKFAASYNDGIPTGSNYTEYFEGEDNPNGEKFLPVFSLKDFTSIKNPVEEYYSGKSEYYKVAVGAKNLFIFDPNYTEIGDYSFSISNWSGAIVGSSSECLVYYEAGCNIKYKSSSATKTIMDVNDDYILGGNDIEMYVKTIYNNPFFMRMDEDAYTNVEASLMATPEMGFKYGLFLDSEDCEISNDQYDDLVTVNQFKAVDRSKDKYGMDIDDANFIIVDKQKTVVQGVGGNIGYFTAIIDPFDALKAQRLLVNPMDAETTRTVIHSTNKSISKTYSFNHTKANIEHLDYWAYESTEAWNQLYDDLLNSMDCLQRVRNADGIYIGEPNPIDGNLNILDSWSIPLTGGYNDESISKILMRKFPGIPMANVSSEDLENPDYKPSIIDHNYMTHICVAVCKTTIDQSNGKIVVQLVETFFGSLFNERNLQNGRSLFIGDIINENSDFIEFYRNDYVSAGAGGAYDPPEYKRTEVNQIFIKDTEELKNAAQMRGIDYEEEGCDALDPVEREKNLKAYYDKLKAYHIFAIDKKEVCLYNLHWEANLTSFSKKESQKIIANTSGLYSVSDGTTVNVAKNFLVDMDRCIKFIKNIDDIPLHFICDAGLSTIAQFCDNIIWNPDKKTVIGEYVDPVTKKKTGVKKYSKTGGWITQPFDPDNDPDGEDRYITGYEDVATWRKVVEKITSIAGEIRKDCFAIIDAPRQLTLDGAAPKIRRTKFDNNFDKTIGKCLRYISGLNSSYVAGYYNWLRTTDQYTGKSIWIPPTSKIIGNYCYLNINNLPWLAPAGLTYGLISGCHAISHNPDYQEEDQIYMKSWNYIKQYPFDGLVVEGQRTLLGKESAFERVNVRLLFLDLERFAYNVSRTFKYQVNNTYTREQFVQTLKPKFEDYTLRGGIYEYLIKVDETNNTPETIDANELRGDIFIKPARLIEFVLLNFCATSTATDFTELQLG